jgi:hypothetical protein
MGVFPDPGSNDLPVSTGDAYYQVLVEGIAPPGPFGWILWGFGTNQLPGRYPAPKTLKAFHAVPVWPNASVRVLSVTVDVPTDAPDTLRYYVRLQNDGPGDAGYRLFSVSHPLTFNAAEGASPTD